MAVEPRKINPPGTNTSESAKEVVAAVAAADLIPANESEVKEAKEGSSPLIPILAGIVGIVVVGLLLKVMKAK